MAAIELEHVTKVFSGGVVAVDDVSLRVEDGEFMVLVGPSGAARRPASAALPLPSRTGSRRDLDRRKGRHRPRASAP